MRDSDFHPSQPMPLDQADGLRRMFAARRVRLLAVASNPHVAFAGVLLERLTAACAALGLKSLVVDAAENAPAPHEYAALDLSVCVEPLAPGVAYLAARGLPIRHVDARGSCAGFLQAAADAAPDADVLVVHAPAAELSRMLGRRALRPLLLAADHPGSVTHAYASMKLLAARNGLMSYDLLLSCDPQSPRRERIAPQLADTADRFLGAVLQDWALVDPASDLQDLPTPELLRLAQRLVQADDEALMPAAAPTSNPARPFAHATCL